MQAAPFPPHPAAHFSAHDAACAKLEPAIKKQNIAVAAKNLDIFSSSRWARQNCPAWRPKNSSIIVVRLGLLRFQHSARENARQATAGRGLFVAPHEPNRKPAGGLQPACRVYSALPANSGSFDDLGRNPSRLIFGEQRCCLPARSPAR